MPPTPSTTNKSAVRYPAQGVVDRCLREAGIARETVLRRRGGRDVERKRHAAMWAAHRTLRGTPRGTWGALARMFARDHSTIMSNVARAERLRDEDDDFRMLTERMLAAAGAQQPGDTICSD